MALAISDATLITRVRELINEPSALEVSDTDITNWCNEAAQEIAQYTLIWQDDSTTDQLETGVRRYPYTAVIQATYACVRMNAVWYLGAASSSYITGAEKALVKVSPRLFKQLDDGTAGVPKYWTDIGEQVYVYPIPSASENTHYIQYFFSKAYIPLTGGGITAVLPDWLQEYVIWYVLAKVYEADRKYAIHDQYMSIFKNFLAFHKANKYIPNVDSKDMMSIQDRTQIEQ